MQINLGFRVYKFHGKKKEFSTWVDSLEQAQKKFQIQIFPSEENQREFISWDRRISPVPRKYFKVIKI